MAHDLQKMMDGELVRLQLEIKKEQDRRLAEKMIPVFGVWQSPINQYEFADPAQAISCAAGLLDKVHHEVQDDLSKGGLQGWNGDLLRIYVQHVNESDFAVLQPHLKDKKS